MSGDLSGLLLVDKPSGPTSHDVVARVRRLLAVRRVGHAGTLDPAAGGLLPLVLGRATRLVRFLPRSPKVYRGRLQLGVTTDTDDLTGKVLVRSSAPLPDVERVVAAARALEGRSLQVTPRYSARKVGGERLHRLARRGLAGTPPAVEVEVTRFDIRSSAPDGIVEFEAEVSAGTYVRALARDLGAALGTGGTLAELRRLSIGPLSIANAIELPRSEDASARERLEAALIPPAAMPLTISRVALDDERQVERFNRGLSVTLAFETPETAELVGVLDPGGDLIGMAEPRRGTLQPRIVLDQA